MATRTIENPAETATDAAGPCRVIALADDPRWRGRGARTNETGRFETEQRRDFDDGWQSLDELPPFKTVEREERARKIITRLAQGQASET